MKNKQETDNEKTKVFGKFTIFQIVVTFIAIIAIVVVAIVVLPKNKETVSNNNDTEEILSNTKESTTDTNIAQSDTQQESITIVETQQEQLEDKKDETSSFNEKLIENESTTKENTTASLINKPANLSSEGIVSKVIGDNLNVRKGPGTNYESIAKVNTGDTFEIYGSENGWYYGKLSDERWGWVVQDYISTNNSNSAGADLKAIKAYYDKLVSEGNVDDDIKIKAVFIDLNNDGIPEIVSDKSTEEFYTYSNNKWKVVKIPEGTGMWNFDHSYYKQDGIIHLQSGHMYMTRTDLYCKFDGEQIIQICKLDSSDGRYDEVNQKYMGEGFKRFYKDGELVKSLENADPTSSEFTEIENEYDEYVESLNIQGKPVLIDDTKENATATTMGELKKYAAGQLSWK